jgi:DNA-binding NarL/FixJ family response regulator
MADTIRIVVADDHPLLRQGVVQTLQSEPDISVIGEAGTGSKAIELAKELLPDLIVLDLTMPGVDGIEASRRISAACPATRILILTVSEERDDLLEALKAGARGYVLKGVGGAGLVHAVRVIMSEEVYVSPALASGILHEMTRTTPDPFDLLTARERDILELVAEGHTNREIGERLYLSEKTVKHYMTNVLQKLHVRSRVEAALLAQRRELEGQ